KDRPAGPSAGERADLFRFKPDGGNGKAPAGRGKRRAGALGRGEREEDQKAIFSSSQPFSWSMGRRTCSIVSRSRTVTQLSAAMPLASSPTVSKSTVMQYGVPISSSRR